MKRQPLVIALTLALASPWSLASAADVDQDPHAGHAGHGAHGAHAATPPEGSTPIEGVVVVGVAPSQSNTFVTDPKLPRQPVPASDGADYLKTIPGFSLVRSGGTNGDPVLRGMFGSRLNLLTNDGAMSGACPSRMDNAMSYIAPETYDRLTVIKGPQSVLWGGGASAGTVRFEREIPYFDRPGVRINASALASGANRNDQVLDVAAGSKGGYARVSANRSEAEDYRDGNGDIVPSAWNKWNADAAVGWTPSEDTVLEVSAGTGDAWARYAGRGMDGSQFKRESLGLRFEKKHIGGVFDAIVANVYHNDVDHVMDNYTLRTPNPASSMPMPMASNVRHITRGGRVAGTWQADHWEITAGVDLRRSRHSQRSGMGRGTYVQKPWTVDAKFGNTGVFAESHWHLTGKHHVMSGVRIDRGEVEDVRKMTSGMMPMPNPTRGMTRKETLPSAFVRYEYDMAGKWGAYAGLGHTQRMPDYWELFSPKSGPVGSVNAFAGVQPERTTQLDLGMQYRGDNLNAWASVYVGRMQDYIAFDYLSSGMGMSMTTRARNLDADIRGGEAGVEWQIADAWKLGGVVAYAWGKDTATGRPLPQMPPLEARFTANYQGKRWNAGALLRVVDNQDRVNTGQGNVVGRDLGPSPGFAIFSLNAGYRIDDRLQVTAGIDNIFDRAYSEHLNLSGNSAFGYPADPVRINEPGRTAWLKLNFTY